MRKKLTVMQSSKSESSYRNALRGRILDVAMHAFATKGIRAVKMDDIAQSLTISKRTLYELYDNKEKLLLEGVKKFRVQSETDQQRIIDECPTVIDVIVRLYRKRVDEFKLTSPTFYSDLVKYPSVQRYLHQNRQQSHQRFIQFLQRGVAEGYFRNDVELELVAQLFAAISDHIMGHQLYNSYTIEQVFHDLILVSLRGFCTPQGITKLDRYFKQSQ